MPFDMALIPSTPVLHSSQFANEAYRNIITITSKQTKTKATQLFSDNKQKNEN